MTAKELEIENERFKYNGFKLIKVTIYEFNVIIFLQISQFYDTFFCFSPLKINNSLKGLSLLPFTPVVPV
jgi:hypothetical protein